MRMFTIISACALIGTTAFTGMASAQMQGAPAKAPLKPVFISEDLLNPATLLPPPVSPDSAEGKAELELVRATVKAAPPADIKRAAVDDEDETVSLYAIVLPGFDIKTLPATALLFKHVENDQNYATKKAKTYFARKRPFELDPAIPTCVPSAQGKAPTSYPSGHSTLGFTDGIILAHLIPSKATAILVRAKDYANNRVICGVHFPSDTVASQALATGLAIEMMQSPQFQKEFAAAKAELMAAGLN
jgi:acid phosphatase (class A)